MRKFLFTAVAIVLAWGISCYQYVNADTPAEAAAKATLTYLHLYTDPDGMTHFRDESFGFKSAGNPGSPPSMSYHELAGAQGASLVKMKKGAKEGWHNAPRTQFAIVIQGAVELTAGDGEVRILSPGTIALLDDTRGKGHKTTAVGTVDHIALMIPVKTSHK